MSSAKAGRTKLKVTSEKLKVTKVERNKIPPREMSFLKNFLVSITFSIVVDLREKDNVGEEIIILLHSFLAIWFNG